MTILIIYWKNGKLLHCKIVPLFTINEEHLLFELKEAIDFLFMTIEPLFHVDPYAMLSKI